MKLQLTDRNLQRYHLAGTLVVVPMDVTLRRELRAVWPGPAQPVGPVADLVRIASGR